MAYRIINKEGLATGDKGFIIQCTSAIFNYQVLNGTVEFSGSNVPDPDVDNEDHWVPIVTIVAGTPDIEPFRQHVWDAIRYKVTAGSGVAIYVTSGVSG